MRAPPERRPLGSDDFVTQLEDLVQRRLRRQKRDERPKRRRTQEIFSRQWTAGQPSRAICKVLPQFLNSGRPKLRTGRASRSLPNGELHERAVP